MQMVTARRKNLLAAELGRFVQQYKRKAQKGTEPNDRRYSSKVEEQMKHLSPEELSELLNGETEEPITPIKRKQLPDPLASLRRKRNK